MTWIMYCQPHYRYSCNVYDNLENGNKKDQALKEEIERGYRSSFKETLNIPKTTSTKWVKDMIKEWNY